MVKSNKNVNVFVVETNIGDYQIHSDCIVKYGIKKGKVQDELFFEAIEESDRIKYELILGFRKLKGINKYDFKKKFNINIYEVPNIKDMLDKGMLEENNEYIYIPSSWIYKSNEILVRLV